MLPSGDNGIYAFRIGAKPHGAFEVQHELCVVNSGSQRLAPASKYEIRSGEIVECSLPTRPAAAGDRLFLVAVSGQPEFHPLFDALLRMGFYNFNPGVIRELQSPDPGEVLASDGRNLASVLKRLAEQPDGQLARVVERLGQIVPGITGVDHKPVGKKETLEFRQLMAGSREAWRFDAENLSDGTLRALGVLVAHRLLTVDLLELWALKNLKRPCIPARPEFCGQRSLKRRAIPKLLSQATAPTSWMTRKFRRIPWFQ